MFGDKQKRDRLKLHRPRSDPPFARWFRCLFPTGLRAADKSCEAPPSLTQDVYQQPCLFARRLVIGNSVPPKEPPRSVLGSASPETPRNLSSSSLTQLTLSTFSPLFVERRFSNDCANAGPCPTRWIDAFHSLGKSVHTNRRQLAVRHNTATGMEIFCSCSIQNDGSNALKALAVIMVVDRAYDTSANQVSEARASARATSRIELVVKSSGD